MAIYTRWNEAVQLTEARMAPMWIERRHGEIRRHFSKPKRTKQTVEIEETVAWLVRGTGTGGRPLKDGRWFELIELVADDGIREINDEFKRVIGEDELAKFDAWNKKNAPEADHFWPAIGTKEVG